MTGPCWHDTPHNTVRLEHELVPDMTNSLWEGLPYEGRRPGIVIRGILGDTLNEGKERQVGTLALGFETSAGAIATSQELLDVFQAVRRIAADLREAGK